MNQPFMFMPVINPMADNAAFIGKTVRRKKVCIIALCCAVLMTALLFGMLFSFNYSDTEFSGSQFDTDSKSIAMAELGMNFLLPFAAMIPASIAAVNYMAETRRSQQTALRYTNMTAAKVFCALFLFHCLIGLFSTVGKLAAESKSDSAMNNDSIDILLMSALPLVLMSVWTIAGFIFFTSAGRTLRGLTVSASGSRFFRVMSLITAVMNIVIPVVYDINGFSGGLFNSSVSGVNTGEIVRNNMVAVVVFHMYFIASAIALFEAAGFAADYKKAVDAAIRSLRMTGVNMYMNGRGSAAAYYNDTYTAAAQQPGQDIPPQPVQPEYQTVQPQQGYNVPAQTVQPDYQTQIQQGYNAPPQTVQPDYQTQVQQGYNAPPQTVQPDYQTQAQQGYNAPSQPYNRPSGFM